MDSAPPTTRNAHRTSRSPVLWALLALAVGLGFPLATAQTAPAPLQLTLSAQRVVVMATDQGSVETLQPADQAAPGDVLEWRLTATNTTDHALQQVVLTLPIPAQDGYLAGTLLAGPQAAPVALPDAAAPTDATLPTPLFSADGGASYAAAPLTRTLTRTVNGKQVTETRTLAPATYTDLRLTVPEMQPGTTYVVLVRTEVR